MKMGYDVLFRDWKHIYDLCEINDDASNMEIVRKIMDRCVFLSLTPVGKLMGDMEKISDQKIEDVDIFLKICDVSKINLSVCVSVLTSTKWYKSKLQNREKFISIAWELALKKYNEADAHRLLDLKI